MLTLLFLMFAFQSDEIATEEIGPLVVQETFTLAVQKFNSVERKDAQPLFEALVRNIEAKQDADSNHRRMLLESLNYLAMITFPEGTEDWYRKMIAADPSYDLPLEETISPKIRAVYERLRKELLGQLRVSATDASTGSRLDRLVLLVDGKIIGPVVGELLVTLTTGPHKIELMRPNFSGGEANIVVVADSESSFQPSMTRQSAEAVVVTVPADVEIKSKGQSLGFTRSPAPEVFREELSKIGATPELAGAFIVDRLELGKYPIHLERSCYVSEFNNLPVDQIHQILILPIKLKPAEAFLSVHTPSGENGTVLLNDTQIGILPLENQKICPGDYELKVQFSDGSFATHLSLGQNETREISAQPQPTLAWLGLDLRGEGAPPQDPTLWIQALKTWAVLNTPLNEVTKDLVEPLFSGIAPSEAQQATLFRIQAADLYLAARVVRHKQVIRRIEVAFWSPRSTKVQTFAIDFRELDRLHEIIKGLDSVPPLVKPWLGIQVARLAGVSGCQVLEVNPKGPLAGKIKPGEVIRAVNGSPLRNPNELIEIRSLEELNLELADRQIQVKPQASIAEVPFDTSGSVAPAWIAKSAKLAKYDPSQLVRQSASFNMARFLFFTGDYKPSFDLFSTMQLPNVPGINGGTLYFYQGLCFRKLNLTSEAQDAFRQVLNFPDATLFDAYGPRAAFWAEAELKNTSF